MKTIKLSFLSLVVAALLIHAASAQALTYTLSWIANPVNDAVTGYNVYERVGTVYTKLGTVTAPTFSLGSPTAGVVHFYAISAVNIDGESPKSPEAILPTGPPGTPVGQKISSP